MTDQDLEKFLITPAAVDAIALFKKENASWNLLPLRVYLAGKGCDGFSYGVTFDNPSNSDITFPYDTFTLVCDADTYKFVKGSTLDFADDERGRGFVVINPRQREFRGKFFRKKAWKDILTTAKTNHEIQSES